MLLLAVRSLLARLAEMVNGSDELKGLFRGMSAVYQYRLSGEDPFYVEIRDDGSIAVSDGEHSSPTATIESSSEVMEKIIRGELDGVAAYFRGQLKIHGDLMSVQRLANVLSRVRGRVQL